MVFTSISGAIMPHKIMVNQALKKNPTPAAGMAQKPISHLHWSFPIECSLRWSCIRGQPPVQTTPETPCCIIAPNLAPNIGKGAGFHPAPFGQTVKPMLCSVQGRAKYKDQGTRPFTPLQEDILDFFLCHLLLESLPLLNREDTKIARFTYLHLALPNPHHRTATA